MAAPRLERRTVDGVTFWTDPVLFARGTIVAFSERTGGVSEQPFESLNLAAHVGDDPAAVDENRTRLLGAIGLSGLRPSLTMAEQVHGDHVAVVRAPERGGGDYARDGRPPLVATDALVTREASVPLALCFADCVPIVLAVPGRAVAVVHAGWRGALGSLPGKVVRRLGAEAPCDAGAILAFIGAHIGPLEYVISCELMSQFVNTFGTFARAESGGLDLDAVVTASLESAGVAPCNIARLGISTAEATDRFFSYRAESGCTGRHAALACLLRPESPRSR